MDELRIRRGFVDVEAGQVHYRWAGNAPPWDSGQVLVMIHQSPGSSKMLERLMGLLATQVTVLAPDTMGNGDSDPPLEDQPQIPYFADRVVDAIRGLGVPVPFDIYGSHTGANIAVDISGRNPDLVRSLTIDGMAVYTPSERTEILDQYTPIIDPDLNGTQIWWAWQFVRDTYLFFPWFKRATENRTAGGLPHAQDLHEKVVEVLKAIGTYRHSYIAAFSYSKEEALQRLTVPTLVTCGPMDVLNRYADDVARLVPHAQRHVVQGAVTHDEHTRSTADAVIAFLADNSHAL